MNAMNQALDFPIAVTEYNSVVKPLDYKFSSFGEAQAAWLNSLGWTDNERKTASPVMVRAFVTALGLKFVTFGLTRQLPWGAYYESDAFFFNYMKQKGYIQTTVGEYILLDKYHRPIMIVVVGPCPRINLDIDAYGAGNEINELRELMRTNYKMDPAAVRKKTYVEVVLNRMSDSLMTQNNAIENERIALPEYYPYLEGGVVQLIKDFLESEESVLIIQGPPGTGKTSGVSAAITSLDLLPVYAKKTDVVSHKEFVSYVFGISDMHMANFAGTEANDRKKLFLESIAEEERFLVDGPFEKDPEEAARIPVVIVEDADVLISSRTDGNPLMADLLNETDGLGSNHTRKIIFNTNITDLKLIDEALMRPGRCYGVFNFRLLTVEEALIAREVSGLPPLTTVPDKNISLAEALRKPRGRISVSGGKPSIGFGS